MMRFHMIATMRVEAQSLEQAQKIVSWRLATATGGDDVDGVVSTVHVTGTPITTNEGATDDRAR